MARGFTLKPLDSLAVALSPWGQIGAFRMKWFWPALMVIVFLIVDHIYTGGRAADEFFGIFRSIGLSIVHWSDDLLGPLRR
jgi:hypothetical protein